MMLLKKIAPKSLYARFLMIIIIPTVLVQCIAIYIFYERHWSSMSRNMSAALAGEISVVVESFRNSELSEIRLIFDAAEHFMGLSVSFLPENKVPSNQNNTHYSQLEEEMRKKFDNPFSIQAPDSSENVHVFIGFDSGILKISFSKKRLASATTYIFIMWMTGTAVIFLGVSILFLKNQVRSIVRLASAAERFGKEQDMPFFKPEGAREVRSAGIAFLQMKERINRLIKRRTELLAGVSHDLRTPLTRMKLQLAMMKKPDNAVKELQGDIQEMEQMLDGYLEFARGSGNEKTSEIALEGFLKKVVSGYKHHRRSISLKVAKDISITVKPNLLRRVLSNLIDNALRYGTHVWVNAKSTRDTLTIEIEDDGPGIPEDKREEVFQPFSRLETSRNRKTGGVGLGLSIVRDAIHAHGGSIVLDKSTHGGLKAIIRIPR